MHSEINLSFETVLTMGAGSNLSSLVAATYAELNANGNKKRKEILFRASRELLLLNCFNRRETTGSLCGRKPFALKEREVVRCSMRLPIKA